MIGERGILVVMSNYIEHRPWGSFEHLLDTDYCKVKEIIVKPKGILSLQKHFHRSEQWLITKGKPLITLNKKRFIICEGYTDVICLHSFGYPAVASLGTALTEDQIETIFNIVDEAFLVFDGDIAGKNATERVFQKYLPKLMLN